MKSYKPKYKLVVQGRAYREDKQALCLAKLLEIFMERDPSFKDWILAKKGRKVRLMATNPAGLRVNEGDRMDLAERNSVALSNGLFMYTLWSGDKVLMLMDACSAKMRLKFGEDVLVDLDEWGQPDFKSTALNIEDIL